jgi:hypothetical protein
VTAGSGWRRAALLACALAAAAACGKRGDPLPPLRPIPARIADLAARRTADRVELAFTVPAANQDGTTPPAADRIDLFATTLPAGAPAPTAAQLMASADNLIGRLTIRDAEAAPGSAVVPGTGAPSPASPTPGPIGTSGAGPRLVQPGEMARFVETGVETTLSVPAESAAVPPDAAAAAAASAALDQAAAEAAAEAPTEGSAAVRYYVAVAVAGTGDGRPGPPSDLLRVPLEPVPAPPADLTVTHDASDIVVSWTPAAADHRFRVLRGASVEAALEPVTPEPIAESTHRLPVEFDRQVCFSVIAVAGAPPVTSEGDASAVRCVTPLDTFPPPAPEGLQAVAGADAITLVWTAVDAPDLAGYIVLRGGPTGGNLEPLFRTPIAATTYRDATAERGLTYTYAVYAVDRAPTPNVSQLSARQSATIR